jgi:hypothetical protein
LDGIAKFLREHVDQVLSVTVEDYVPSSTIKQTFGSAGLAPLVATLKMHAALPRLAN